VSGTYAVVNPEALGPTSGFNHGFVSPAGGRLLFVAGQPGLDASGKVVSGDFVDQFDQALSRVLTVVGAAGGRAEHVMRMTIYVTSMEQYQASRRALGDVWRARMGRHYPAVALVGVTALVDEGALVEIEATAVLP
jgi:enamine deaminase RidA (YjgF/YER057c/UK114 family)